MIIVRMLRYAAIALIVGWLGRSWLQIPAEQIQYFYGAIVLGLFTVYALAFDSGWNGHIDDTADEEIKRARAKQQQGRR